MVSKLWQEAYKARDLEIEADKALQSARKLSDLGQISGVDFNALHDRCEACSQARELAFLAAHRAEPKFFAAKAGK